MEWAFLFLPTTGLLHFSAILFHDKVMLSSRTPKPSAITFASKYDVQVEMRNIVFGWVATLK
jgi:hypothetical protein